MKTIEEINQHNVKKILSEKKIPDFYPGDEVKVGVRITEGKKERRAKLYYLRDRTGKSARIAEKIRKKFGIDVDVKPETVTEENVAPIVEAPKEETPAVEAASAVEAPKEETPAVETSKEEPKSESPSEKK